MAAKSEICELCGTREADWIDPETGQLYDPPKLTPIDITCYGCRDKEQFRKQNHKNGAPAGSHTHLVPFEWVDRYGKLIKPKPQGSVNGVS